jgi:hypothetical protein
VFISVCAWPAAAYARDAAEWGDAAERPPPTFGDSKQWVVTGAFNVSVDRWFYSETEDESFAALVAPSLDYFVVQNFSVGANLVFAYTNTESSLGIPFDRTSTLYGAGLRAGYNVRFSRLVSLWLRPGVGIWRRHVDQSGIIYDGSGTNLVSFDEEFDQTAVWVDLYLPFLFHPSEHFFLGIGPEVIEDLSNDRDSAGGRRHFRGITSMVGGWF